jgi:ribonuclease HI
MEYMVWLHFPTSNNVAKYEALINGLRIAIKLGFRRLEIRGDSELVIDQVMKEKNCIDSKMVAYCRTVRELEVKFHSLELHHVLCDYNKAADILAKIALSRKLVPNGVFASDQLAPPVRVDEEQPQEHRVPEVMEIDQQLKPNLEDPDWRISIVEWLVERKLPSDQTEACCISQRAKAFILIDVELYK